MKKILWSIVAVMALSIVFAGCGKSDDGVNKSDSPDVKAANAKKKTD